jgi:hypothetical protein
MIEITIPKCAFTAETKEQLDRDLTTALLKWEGAPDNAQSNSIDWAYVYEVEEYAVGGRLQTADGGHGTASSTPSHRVHSTIAERPAWSRRSRPSYWTRKGSPSTL